MATKTNPTASSTLNVIRVPQVPDGLRRAACGPSAGLIWRAIGAAFFVGAGANHFINPTFYERIVPPSIPDPSAMVSISGVAEIVGGLGLLSRRLRQPARWGLIALLVAVFPANVFMAVDPRRASAEDMPRWALWARLPLQGILIGWVWWLTRPDAYARSRTNVSGGDQ